MDAIDSLILELSPEEQDRFVLAYIREVLRLQPMSGAEVENALSKVGWEISGTELVEGWCTVGL